jgi:hypothetical protein
MAFRQQTRISGRRPLLDFNQIMSKQFNRDDGDEKDVSFQTKVSTKINAETLRR